MLFISAGHCNIKGPKYDPGAVGVNQRTEAGETERVRNQVIAVLKAQGHGADIIRDADNETLAEYLHRIKPGNASVVCEFHFNAVANKEVSGTEVIVASDADRLDKAAAQDFANVTAQILGIKNRGVKSEAQSDRGRLGLMREQGIVILVEVCFISNPDDMVKYDSNFLTLCNSYASLLLRYDDLIK